MLEYLFETTASCGFYVVNQSLFAQNPMDIGIANYGAMGDDSWEKRASRSPRILQITYHQTISTVADRIPVVDTVDGRNPAPVDIVNIPLFTGYYTNPRWLFGISSINSMVNISPMS